MFGKQNPIVKLIVEAPNEQWENLGYYMQLKGKEGIAITISRLGSAYPLNSNNHTNTLVKYDPKVRAKFKALQLYFIQKALGHD